MKTKKLSNKSLKKEKHRERERVSKYKQAFDTVTEVYLESKSVSCSATVEGLYADDPENPHTKRCAGRVVVNPLDFSVDVELAVKRVIDTTAYMRFLTGDLEHLDKEMRLKIGREFVIRKIFPIEPYLAPKDVK